MPDATLLIKRFDTTLPLPSYAHEGDAGLDLFAAEDRTLAPFERALIGTGIAVAIPGGYAGFVQPRSGLAIQRGLSLVNTPGLIDSHYRGEIKIIAINLDPASHAVRRSHSWSYRPWNAPYSSRSRISAQRLGGKTVLAAPVSNRLQPRAKVGRGPRTLVSFSIYITSSRHGHVKGGMATAA